MNRVQARDLVAATLLLGAPGAAYARVSMPVQMRGETFFLIFPGDTKWEICLEDMNALADALMIEADLIHFAPVLIFPPDYTPALHLPIYARFAPFDYWQTDRLAQMLQRDLREGLYVSGATMNQDGVEYQGPTNYAGRPYPVRQEFYNGPMLLLRITAELVDPDAEDPCPLCMGRGAVAEGDTIDQCPDCNGTGLQ